jgi:hypothetical protein
VQQGKVSGVSPSVRILPLTALSFAQVTFGSALPPDCQRQVRAVACCAWDCMTRTACMHTGYVHTHTHTHQHHQTAQVCCLMLTALGVPPLPRRVCLLRIELRGDSPDVLRRCRCSGSASSSTSPLRSSPFASILLPTLLETPSPGMLRVPTRGTLNLVGNPRFL